MANNSRTAPNPINTTKQSDWKMFKKFEYNEERDKAGDVRNALLVVAALIAAATFQAGLSPPGGLDQDKTPGKAIFAATNRAFQFFIICNSAALSSSLSLIVLLTRSFPYQTEVLVACFGMLGTYLMAIVVITPPGLYAKINISFLAASMAPFAIRWIRIYSSRKDEEM